MTSSVNVEDRWIRCFHENSGSPVRLVCFPHAGGSASYYFPFSRMLLTDVETLVVQYPGRQDRRDEPLIDSIPVLADRIAEALLPHLDDRPFAFFGHSMGAVLGYEVAGILRARKAPEPSWFFASGRRAPSVHLPGAVHRRDDAGLTAELLRVGGTDQRFLADEELLAAILPVVRNDYRAVETYRWSEGPPLSCPVTVLVGDSDVQTTVPQASAWREHFTGSFDLRVFPGGHFYLDAERPAVLDAVSAVLGRLGADTSFEGSTR